MFKMLLSTSTILNINLEPPVVVEDRQLMVLAAHIATMMRRLTKAQRRGSQQWQKQRQRKGRQQSTKSGSKEAQHITLNVIF